MRCGMLSDVISRMNYEFQMSFFPLAVHSPQTVAKAKGIMLFVQQQKATLAPMCLMCVCFLQSTLFAASFFRCQNENCIDWLVSFHKSHVPCALQSLLRLINKVQARDAITVCCLLTHTRASSWQCSFETRVLCLRVFGRRMYAVRVVCVS